MERRTAASKQKKKCVTRKPRGKKAGNQNKATSAKKEKKKKRKKSGEQPRAHMHAAYIPESCLQRDCDTGRLLFSTTKYIPIASLHIYIDDSDALT